MNTNVTTFEFTPALVLRAIDIDGEPWFVAKDICDVLEIRSDSLRAILDEDELKTTNPKTIGDGPGRDRLLTNESGLYSLILKSRKPEARAFKKWVTSVVLPSIRQHGTFTVPTKAPLPPVPQDYVSALKELIASLECQAVLKGENEALKEELTVRVDLDKWMTGKDIRAQVGVHGRLAHQKNIDFANEMDTIAVDLGVPTHAKRVNAFHTAINVFHPEAAKVWIERHPMHPRLTAPPPATNHVVLPRLHH